MLSLIEAAFHEELDSCVFVPNDDSSKAVGHCLDIVFCAVLRLIAASRLIDSSLCLEFEELFLLILFKTFCENPHVDPFLSFSLFAVSKVLNDIEFLEL